MKMETFSDDTLHAIKLFVWLSITLTITAILFFNPRVEMFGLVAVFTVMLNQTSKTLSPIELSDNPTGLCRLVLAAKILLLLSLGLSILGFYDIGILSQAQQIQAIAILHLACSLREFWMRIRQSE